MINKVKESIEKSIKHLEIEYSKLQLGRANPIMIEWIMIEQYGSMQALQNLSSISNLDAQTLIIKPWDKTIIHSIAKSISDSNLWLNPQNMADSILIKVPALTEERRKELVKVAKSMSEDAKVGIRNARADAMKDIKNSEDSKEISEDQRKDLENDLQKIIDDANSNIENHFKHKEIDIMKI